MYSSEWQYYISRTQVPCETLSHANIQMLLRKLESQVEYAITESIFESLASPEHVNTLVEVMNSTLPVIQTHINSTEDEEEGFNGSVDIPDCSNYLCQDNCSMCIANCAVHRLKRGVVDLIQLVEDDRNLLPQCAVCVEESLQTEAVEIANMLDAIADEMLPRPPENLCVSCRSLMHVGRLIHCFTRSCAYFYCSPFPNCITVINILNCKGDWR